MYDPLESGFDGLRVLLVDDDDACRTFLSLGLNMQGAIVVQVGSAEEAIEALRQSHFDAIATDVNLPGDDGFSLLRYVRKHVGDIPVVLITGYSSVRSAVDALKLGAQDYLAKPIENVDVFLGTIWKAVEYHRVTIQNKALQERVGRAEKMEALANLAGGVAHDLNNIISPMIALPDIIISELEVIGKNSGSDISEIREDLLLMKASGTRAAAVVRDLMTSSRRLNLEQRPSDLNQIVKNCVESQEVKEIKLISPELHLEMELADSACVIMASEPHVSRAVSNLIRNGLEAMDERITGIHPKVSKLHITTRLSTVTKSLIGFDIIEPGEYAVVRVADAGIGVRSDTLPRICEPFFTTKKETGRSGSGLGLAVVYGIMKDHHGFIDVRSKEGEGSVFDLYFPLSVDALPDAISKASAGGGDECILIVDDEPAQRIVAARILRKLGYKVHAVNNGHDALKFLLEEAEKNGNGANQFNLIVLDMIMEDGFDGLDTLKEVQRLFPAMKTVIASGFAPTGRVQAAMDMGAGWIAKPYELNQLSCVIREQL